MRTKEQCKRLAFEEKLLQKYMSNFRFYDKTGDTYVGGWVTPNGTSKRYRLRLDIPDDYPDYVPQLYVTFPVTLWKHGGSGNLNDDKPSHRFHKQGTGHGGCVEICTVEDWNPSLTCVKLLIMGVLWLEAYEAHLDSGKDIADFLC